MQYVILMCSERSGSNLITRMMDAHPAVCGPTPAHLVRVVAENLPRWGDLTSPGHWSAFLSDVEDLLATKLGTWRTSWSSSDLAAAAPDHDPATLVRTVLETEARACGASTLFLKENHSWRYLTFLERAFPDARFVGLVRDPRDMALSWKRSPILRGGVVRASGIWRDDQDGLARTRSWLGPERMTVARYEDLVANPDAVLESICSFLGITPARAMLDFHERTSNTDAAGRTDDWKNLSRPVMSTNYGKWRNGLTTDEIACVERTCDHLMQAFGYEATSDDPRSAPELQSDLSPLERWEKSEYMDVPEAERTVRAARSAVLRRIGVRPWTAPLAAPVRVPEEA